MLKRSAIPFTALQGQNELELKLHGQWIHLDHQDMTELLAVERPKPVTQAIKRIAQGTAKASDYHVAQTWLSAAYFRHIPNWGVMH